MPRAGTCAAQDSLFARYGTDQADLRKLRDLKRKVIVHTGLVDDAIPPAGNVHYHERVAATMGGQAEVQTFMRMYLVPGAAHSSQGRAYTVGGNNNTVPLPKLPGNANQTPTREQDQFFTRAGRLGRERRRARRHRADLARQQRQLPGVRLPQAHHLGRQRPARSWRAATAAGRRQVNTKRWLRRVATAVGVAWACSAGAIDLQGHRGARGLAPENTLRAFEVALQHGVTTLELDIAITRDGVLVIHHDLALNPAIARDASGHWLEQPSAPIHTMTWHELQRYDVGRLKPGHRYSANYPDQEPFDGARVPRLSDLFELVKKAGNQTVRFAIETKLDPRQPEATLAPEPFASAVVDEIRKAGMAQRAQILSFDWRTLQTVQRIAPEIPTVYLSAQQRFLDNIGAAAPDPSPWTAGFQYREHGSVPRLVKAAGGKFGRCITAMSTPPRSRRRSRSASRCWCGPSTTRRRCGACWTSTSTV